MSMSWAGLIGPLQPVAASAGLRGWYEALCGSAGDADSLGLAVFGGRLAATPGLAFLAGYQAALRALWPDAPAGLGALCATERRTLRLADMFTRWDGAQLNGSKDFVTAGDAVQWLLVSAREESLDEAPSLGLFLVEPAAAGVVLEQGPSLPIVPDIPHARLQLDGAPATRLAGDGWSDYVKPFRTHEDLHVLAALSAWLYGMGLRERWSLGLQLRLLAILGGAAEVARLPAKEPATHLLLAAQLEQFAALQADLDSAMTHAGGHCAALWQRDRAVLTLARGAQARRLEQACSALGLG